VLCAHTVPLTLQFLDGVCSINVTMVEPEEEEKELVHSAPEETPLFTLVFETHVDVFEAIPICPYLETLCPPPDFV